MIGIKPGQKSTTIDDVVWSVTPDGNQDSLERFPYLGAFVAASSASHKLTLYGPTDAVFKQRIAEHLSYWRRTK